MIKHNNPVSLYDRYYQDNIRANIEKLIEEMSNEPNDYAAYKIEMKLKNEINKLTQDDRQTFSVDELIHKLKEHRKHLTRKKYI